MAHRRVLTAIALLCAVVSAAVPVANLAEAKDDSTLAAMEGTNNLQKVGGDDVHSDSAQGKAPKEEVETPTAKEPSTKPDVRSKQIQKDAEKVAPHASGNKGCADHRPHERCLEWKKEGLCGKNDQVKKDCCNTCK